MNSIGKKQIKKQKTSPKTKVQDQMDSWVNSIKHLKEN